MTRFFKHTLFLSAMMIALPAMAQTANNKGGGQTPATPPVDILPPATTEPPAPVPTPAQPTPPIATPAPQPVVPIAALSSAQEAKLNAWLAAADVQGLVTSARRQSKLSGDALIAAVLDRARALRNGRLAPSDFLEIWALRPTAYDPRPGFADAVSKDQLDRWMAAQTPPYAGYDGLRRGLATYTAIKAAGGWPTIPAGPAMGQGSSGARVATLRQRLAIEDNSVSPNGNSYGPDLVAAVQAAQRRYGMNPTGVADAQLLASLNVPVDGRIAAIMANMERWRWMPRTLPTHRIQVNIAAAVLTVFEGDKPIFSMRSVTGSPDNQTPMLQSRIHSIVLNPPWNVPASIASKELWPKERAHPGALRAMGYQIITGADGSKRIVQPAGPDASLGYLKFDFDNPFAVYLHDTPHRARFASFDRLASHGCVRLEKPVQLAELVLKDDPKWQPAAIRAAIDTGKTQRVMLPQQVAVYLLYWSAFASANGQINFREDPYGWDKILAAKIDASTRRADASGGQGEK